MLVYQCSQKLTQDPERWTAALFHDIGKATERATHAEIGADMLDGIFTAPTGIRFILLILFRFFRKKRLSRPCIDLKSFIS